MEISYGRDQKLAGSLSGNFEKDYGFIEKVLDKSGDIVKNRFCIDNGNCQAAVVYVDGMTNSDMIEDFVIRPLLRKQCEERGKELLSHVEKNVIQTVDWKEDRTFEDILTDILSGNTLLLLESCPKAVIFSTKDYPGRGVGETRQEMVIRGPRDSFTENLRTNTALIRRRIRDPRLKMEHTMVGERSRTDLAIVYMEDLVRPELLSGVKKQIDELSFDGIFDGGMVEQLLEENPWTPFPQFQNTERPDKAASGLLEGRIVLVVDNSPCVLLLPVTYQMFFQAGDDYYTRFGVASFARLLRFAASLFAIGFPGLYVAIASFHTEMLPASFLMSIALARTGIAIPVAFEVLLMEFQFELLREAGIHLPGQLGGTIGIVGGLIVGQAAVDAGIVSTIVVIVVSFTAIASFIVPSESFGSVFRLLKFLFILAAAFWGIYGYLLVFTGLLFHLSQLESYGVPYMLPSVCGGNLDYNANKDFYVRYPFFSMKKRPVFTREGRRIRKKEKGQ
ncbi:MAG: spore germination protein [Eubacterium sp.]|nr:spore germination protein [Eubacterium sp.]MDD7208949.1 spore germination protein [Lachnospiraceae bacterium]MDY5496598.1 spore germination protein [Anaerobutyricum sp.]